MKHRSVVSVSVLSMALAVILADTAQAQDAGKQEKKAAESRVTESSTSNTTAAYDTRRAQELDRIEVTAQSPVLGGGSMMIQTAPKAISTITREAIQEEAGGSNFTQLIDSIPGVDASTDDVSGLSNGNYSLRGFDASSIGITVNGAPITDTGSYSVYGTQYGDAENYNDITVLQGTPNVDMPDMGASGGHIAWSTIDPKHEMGVDFTQSFGSDDYRRTFARFNTGDTGPVRSWLSVSKNTKDKWKGAGDLDVTKIDGKSLWQIDDLNSISFSFQYSRQQNARYMSGKKAEIQQDYDYDPVEAEWDPAAYAGTGNKGFSIGQYYVKLARNPYSNIMVSADGEFTFTDNLRLSVVPYYYYGDGGSGQGYALRETRNYGNNRFGYSNVDLNGDGKVPTGTGSTSNYFMTYRFSSNKTARPGMVAKFIQNIGLDHTLSYGAWWERSRKTSVQDYGLVDQLTGQPCDVWDETDACLVKYQDGTPMEAFRTYTVTTVQKYFIQDNWTPTDQWTVNLGAAYMRANRSGHSYQWPNATYGTQKEIAVDFDNSYSKFTPTLGVKYALDDRNQFFYGVGKTFRVPETNAITINLAAGEQTAKPETAITHDLGWRYYGTDFGMAAMLYQSDYRNKQMDSYDQDNGLYTYVWVPKVRMRGVNWEGSYAFNRQWKGYLSYTYTESKVRTDEVTAGNNGTYPVGGNQLVNTPKNIATARLSWSNGTFWASLKARYSGARYGDYMNVEEVGGYTVTSFNAGVHLPDFGFLKDPAIKLNVFNLFDRQAFTYAYSTPWLASTSNHEGQTQVGSKWMPFATNPKYGVLAPRSFSVTLSGSF